MKRNNLEAHTVNTIYIVKENVWCVYIYQTQIRMQACAAIVFYYCDLHNIHML